MIGKSAPTPPPAPDPTVVAAAQTASNQQTALYQSQLNNGDSNGPAGSVTNTYNPATNQWTQNTSLSPAEQDIFNSGTADQSAALGVAGQQIGRVGQALGQGLTAPTLQTGVADPSLQYGFNAGGPIQASVGPQNFNQAVNQTIGANFGGEMALLQPQMQQAEEQQNAGLIAQGLNPNDAAYQNSQTLFNNGQAQQLAQAAVGAVNSGNAEQNTLFGQQYAQGQFANAAQQQATTQNQAQASFANTAAGQAQQQALAAAQFGNQAQQQNFQNTAYAQQQPIDEFSALMGQNQVASPAAAQLGQTSVAPTDVLGAYSLQQQALQSDYQAQMGQYQSGLGGLFSLGSAALGFL